MAHGNKPALVAYKFSKGDLGRETEKAIQIDGEWWPKSRIWELVKPSTAIDLGYIAVPLWLVYSKIPATTVLDLTRAGLIVRYEE